MVSLRSLPIRILPGSLGGAGVLCGFLIALAADTRNLFDTGMVVSAWSFFLALAADQRMQPAIPRDAQMKAENMRQNAISLPALTILCTHDFSLKKDEEIIIALSPNTDQIHAESTSGTVCIRAKSYLFDYILSDKAKMRLSFTRKASYVFSLRALSGPATGKLIELSFGPPKDKEARLKEYEILRDEMKTRTTEQASIERYTIIAGAAVYAVLATLQDYNIDERIGGLTHILWFIPFALVWICYARWTVNGHTIWRIAQYLSEVHEYKGWESHLREPGNGIGSWVTIRRIWKALWLATLAIAVYMVYQGIFEADPLSGFLGGVG